MPDLIPVFIPLAILIFLGFILGRNQSVDLKTVGSLAIFCFTPIVGFGGAAQLLITPSILFLPVITFLLASSVGLLSYTLSKIIKNDDGLSYLLPIATGSGNTGYFGLPVAIAIFGSEITGVYLLANLGVVIFESTIGYYLINRGISSAKQSFLRVVKLPLLYALIAGLIFATLKMELPAPLITLWGMAKGAYVCVGMMIIGIALGQQKSFALSRSFLTIGLLGKFILWPLLALLLLMADTHLMQSLDPKIHGCILLMACAPMAANLAAYASQAGLKVDQAAAMILITTIIAILGLPIVLPVLLSL